MRHILAVFLIVTLAACSSTNEVDTRPADEIYAAAKAKLDDGSFDAAIKQYEKLQSRYPYGRYAQQAMLEMAYAYYKQGEPDPAISAADRFIKQFPNNPHVDYAYYLKGVANFNGEISFINRLGGQDPSERDPEIRQASFNAFKELVSRFPNSKYAPDARLRMQYLSNSMALYDLHIAQYYLRRSAHIAAVNRAQELIRKYPDSTSVRDALQVQVQAYDAMGMAELRDAAQHLLEKTPPAAAK